MYPDATAPATPKDAILIVDDEAPILDAFVAALSPYFDVSSANCTSCLLYTSLP